MPRARFVRSLARSGLPGANGCPILAIDDAQQPAGGAQKPLCGAKLKMMEFRRQPADSAGKSPRETRRNAWSRPGTRSGRGGLGAGTPVFQRWPHRSNRIEPICWLTLVPYSDLITGPRGFKNGFFSVVPRPANIQSEELLPIVFVEWATKAERKPGRQSSGSSAVTTRPVTSFRGHC